MNNDWIDLLKQSGARFTDGLAHFEHRIPPSKTDTGLVDCSPWAIVDVTGEDASTFLQAQSCNDQNAVDESSAQISGYCSPKGRLLAVYSVFAIPNGLRLLLPLDLVEGFIKRLQMFVMRAKVTIKHRDDLVCMGVLIPHTAAADNSSTATVVGELTAMGSINQLPTAVLSLVSDADTSIMRWHDAAAILPDHSRYVCIGPVQQLQPIWLTKDTSVMRYGHDQWRLADITAGLPSVVLATHESFIPQMVNMHLIDALSFKKGCFPGQEIVARMQYLGKLKRHMRRFTVPLTELPAPGTALTTAADPDAGKIVDAVKQGAQVELLAVVKTAVVDAELRVMEQPVTAQPLPYDLPTLN